MPTSVVFAEQRLGALYQYITSTTSTNIPVLWYKAASTPVYLLSHELGKAIHGEVQEF